jgi:PAS domain-containing protein
MADTQVGKPSDNELAEAIIQTIAQPLLILDGDLRVQKVNSAFLNLFQVKPNETWVGLSTIWATDSGTSLGFAAC